MQLCILGAGVLGVASAYELAKRGHDVTVIERQSEPARECSYANGGQLSYSATEPWANPHVFLKVLKWMWQEDAPLVLRFNTDPHMIRWGLRFLLNCLPGPARRHEEVFQRLNLYSKRTFEELYADTNLEFHRLSKGILHVFSDKKEWNFYRRGAEKAALSEKILDWDACLKLEPTLANATLNMLGGIHMPLDESGDIYLFTTRLARLIAAKYGVKFRYNTEVAKLHKKNNTLTHLATTGGEEISGF